MVGKVIEIPYSTAFTPYALEKIIRYHDIGIRLPASPTPGSNIRVVYEEQQNPVPSLVDLVFKAKFPLTPPRQLVSSLDNFWAQDKSQERLYDTMIRFASGSYKGLFIYGESETGKSHMAISIAKLIAQYMPVAYKDISCTNGLMTLDAPRDGEIWILDHVDTATLQEYRSVHSFLKEIEGVDARVILIAEHPMRYISKEIEKNEYGTKAKDVLALMKRMLKPVRVLHPKPEVKTWFDHLDKPILRNT